ncbi:MAG: hypothetical protein ACKVPX_07100 [Myxococcaceae bacterium]
MSVLTSMEREIIGLIAGQHWPGYRLDQLEVTGREHTGVGRYTHIIDRAGQPIPDGTYGADGHFVEMEGIPNGLFFAAEVEGSRLVYLEIVTAGADSWDGVERPWKVA